MVATITTTTDATYMRVGVSLAGWAADGPVTVSRVHVDGSRSVVRGMSGVSGGVAFGWDYETPLDADITFEAWSGGALVASAITQLASGGAALLTIPGLPSFGGPVTPMRKPDFDRVRPFARLDPIGRVNPIIISDVLKAPSFVLTLRTRTPGEAYSLDATLTMGATLLLRMPRTYVTDWCYVRNTSGVAPVPLVPYRPALGAPAGDVAEWYDWAISLQVVESPVGGIFGDPTATYQASLDAFPTYSARLAAAATYIDALSA